MIKALANNINRLRHAIFPLLLVAGLSISTTAFAGDVLFVSDSETDAENIPTVLAGPSSTEVPHPSIAGAGFRAADSGAFHNVTIIRNDYAVTGGSFGEAEGTNLALLGDLFPYCSVFWSASGPHEPLGLFPDRIANGDFENVGGTYPNLTGWTVDAPVFWDFDFGMPPSNGASSGAGFVDLAAGGGFYGQISQALATETGETYQLSIDRQGEGSIVSLDGSNVLLTAGESSGGWTTYTALFTATSDTTNLVIRRNPADVSGVADVDNILFAPFPQTPGLGADGGLHVDADVFQNLDYYVRNGGFVFVTGHDALTHPPSAPAVSNGPLVKFLGGDMATAGQWVNPGLSGVSPALSPITLPPIAGTPSTGGVNQVDGVREQDYLIPPLTDTTALVIGPGGAYWTVRSPYGDGVDDDGVPDGLDLTDGHIAYVANGVFFYETDQLADDGVTPVTETLSDGEDPSWLTPPYNAALLNFAANGCLSAPAAEAPVADNQALSTPQDTPLAITLTGSDPNGDPFTFVLDTLPANGALSGSPLPGDTIPAAITYTPVSGFTGNDSFSFITNDGTNDSAPGTISIEVLAPPPLEVDVGPDVAIDEGDTFVGGGSFSDPDEASPWTLTADYGEGAGPVPLAFNPDKSFDLNNAYPNDDAVFPVTVEVTNFNSDMASDTLLVFINNVAPTVDAGPDDTIDEGDTFVSAGSFTDPGADTWDATVDYDDGAGPQPLALNPDKSFALSHAYAAAGVYTVTVEVTDDDGGVGMDTATVTVEEVAPPSMKCDLDGDGDIDRNDISVIVGLRGTTVPPSDPLADVDDDGIITVGDLRSCVLRCTRPSCAVE